jgi:Tfp pilus assembly protein PilX
MKTNTEEKQKGIVLVMVAVVLFVIVGFVALGVDAGALFSARTSAQSVADAAALAGAFTFINNPKAPQPSTANNHALQVALNNDVMGEPVTADDVTVTTDVNNRRVTVVINSTQPTYFARVLGSATADISVTGTAEASEDSRGGCCTRPWFLPNTIAAPGDICDAECDPAQVLINPATMEVTDFGKSLIGTQMTIKPQTPSSALNPGQFYIIDLPDSMGGNDYRMNIKYGAGLEVECLDNYSVQTGNLVGPTFQGVDDLIGDPPRFEYAGTSEDPARYSRVSDGAIFDMAEGVIVAPIWTSCGMAGFCPDATLMGTTPVVQMIGWSVLFLEGIQGPNLKARLVNVTSCGPGTNTTEGSSALTLPLRLVRVP